MSIDDIVLAAYNGTLPNGVMRLPERLLYQTVKCISLLYKTEQLTKDKASDLKANAISDYRADKTEYENGQNSMRRMAVLFKDVELATTAYRKNRTLENADKVMEILYGIR